MTVCQYRNFDQIKATNLSLQWITLKKFHVWPIWQMAAWGVGNSFKNWLLKSCLSNKNFRCFWWAEITKTTTCCRKLPADRLIMNNMRFQRHSLTKIFQRNQIRATVWTFRLLWLQKADQPVVQVWSRCFRGKPEHTYRVGLWVFHHLTSNVTLHWIYSWIPAISIYSRINACLLVPVHVLNEQQPT